MALSAEYLVTALIVVLVPGTGVVYTVATGMARGRLASVAAAIGCTIGILPSIIASIIGVAALLHTSALAFQALKFAGVAYLAYLAWQTLKDSGPLALKGGSTDRSGYFAVARTGALINTLNPKLSAFFLAFLPQFIDPNSASARLDMIVLSAVFMAMTLIVFVVYGWFAAIVGEKVLTSAAVMRWMRRIVATVFAGFAVRLALAER
jgi:threonine/homoserine/homoserine lactone efflux protein